MASGIPSSKIFFPAGARSFGAPPNGLGLSSLKCAARAASIAGSRPWATLNMNLFVRRRSIRPGADSGSTPLLSRQARYRSSSPIALPRRLVALAAIRIRPRRRAWQRRAHLSRQHEPALCRQLPAPPQAMLVLILGYRPSLTDLRSKLQGRAPWQKVVIKGRSRPNLRCEALSPMWHNGPDDKIYRRSPSKAVH